ncbi:unnamed protein product [Allacma fusca]|uniref:N-acetylglucosamine-6-phosphate deacetylase n=1 Tax=Allacma fusca TaxID=39272 RepID=A0A8J2JAZ6_9HEXA|nr:unnamed protein product [Allacma fusca]
MSKSGSCEPTPGIWSPAQNEPRNIIVKFTNCCLLRNHNIIKDDLWIQAGKIIDPEKLFFRERKLPDKVIDCGGALISPGFIDVQLNGGFGVDFSFDIDTIGEALEKVAQGILAHGVTSFCPTLVSSRKEVYDKALPFLGKKPGGPLGAEVLGAHVEGPFISPGKKGAHDSNVLQKLDNGIQSIIDVYQHVDAIAIITLAPELENAVSVCKELTQRGIIVSVGHSMASIVQGEEAVKNGASFITHLFNAMLPFHHRDPGLVGLLASDQIPQGRTIYYGLIADGIHTHSSTTRIAYRAYPKGIVLVTDACSALGLTDGIHQLGEMAIEVKGMQATIMGTNTLAGSVADMISCITYFWKTTDCTLVEALEAATLHPALLMGIENKKGTLEFETDADFTMLEPNSLDVISTWIAGQCVFQNSQFLPKADLNLK